MSAIVITETATAFIEPVFGGDEEGFRVDVTIYSADDEILVDDSFVHFARCASDLDWDGYYFLDKVERFLDDYGFKPLGDIADKMMVQKVGA